ncbi:cytoplasmic tRNA 2-thiolation protein 2-like [Paramacrobiotus metropolitanus]|uniref:cytoplasmic tRNA 2-thiolation protein 2-like n=1 Tax=Paramacrobiotus metropolitanus TaxID=2943436 RepID=UPI0024464723|nr:cytoplasmic tRNA 2-thiolation protein 2-like [Paramacrobiotus metropolitanus]
MCQVDEDDLEKVSAPAPVLTLADKKQICVKCGEEAVIHLRDEDSKCGKCFIHSVIQKFRTVLSKYQISKCRERILVAVTGGAASSTLLQLIQEATGASHHSRLYFVPVVIHIDESIGDSSASDTSSSERIQSVLAVAEKINQSWDRLYSTSDMVFANETEPCSFTLPEDTGMSKQHCSYRNRLHSLLDSVRSSTAKEELIKLLRLKLLKRIGKQLAITKIFVGDCVDRLAVQLITNTALGKGKHLPIDLGYVDSRDPDFAIIRPLKEITMKEILMFSQLNHVATLQGSSTSEQKSTVFGMTRSFVSDLQQEFPQTVTTLCKTADKLAVSKIVGNSRQDLLCDICAGPVDSSASSNSSCTAEGSIVLSLKLTSSVDMENAFSQDNTCARTDAACQSEDKESGNCCQTSKKPVANLCYFCRWMLSEMKDPELLPATFSMPASLENRRQQMRESIQEFLLDDAEDV